MGQSRVTSQGGWRAGRLPFAGSEYVERPAHTREALDEHIPVVSGYPQDQGSGTRGRLTSAWRKSTVP
jgi:hypothetical protein